MRATQQLATFKVAGGQGFHATSKLCSCQDLAANQIVVDKHCMTVLLHQHKSAVIVAPLTLVAKTYLQLYYYEAWEPKIYKENVARSCAEACSIIPVHDCRPMVAHIC